MCGRIGIVSTENTIDHKSFANTFTQWRCFPILFEPRHFLLEFYLFDGRSFNVQAKALMKIEWVWTNKNALNIAYDVGIWEQCALMDLPIYDEALADHNASHACIGSFFTASQVLKTLISRSKNVCSALIHYQVRIFAHSSKNLPAATLKFAMFSRKFWWKRKIPQYRAHGMFKCMVFQTLLNCVHK